MRQLLSSTEFRRLSFIELILDNDNRITISEASKILACSQKILFNDIDKLDTPYFLLSKDNKFVSVKFRENYCLQDIYIWFARNNLSFQMIEFSFFHHDMSVQEVAEHFGLSISTIYRSISELRKALKDNFDFQIQTNPFRLLGDETSLRHFYYNYFREFYHPLDRPFDHIDPEAHHLFMKYIEDKLQLSMSLSKWQHVRLWYGINYTRISQGYYLNIPLSNPCHIRLVEAVIRLFDDLPKSILHKLLPAESNRHLDRLLVDLGFPFSLNDTIIDFPMTLLQLNHLPVLKDRLHASQSFIKEVQDKFQLPCRNLSYLLVKVVNAVAFYESDFDQCYTLYDSRKSILLYFKKNFPEFFNYLDDNLKKIIPDKDFLSESQHKQVLLTLLSSWEDLYLNLTYRDKIKVLILNNLSTSLTHFFQYYLSYDLPDNIMIYSYEGKDIDMDWINQSDFDMIISNSNLGSSCDKVLVNIDNINIPNNIVRIFQGFNQVRHKRKRKGFLMYETLISGQ